MTNTATDQTLIDALADNDVTFVDDTSAGATTKKMTALQIFNYVKALLLSTVSVYTKQQNFGTVAITSTSNSIAWNLDDAQAAKHTFTENTTLANPTNLVDGGTYTLTLTQHASSPKTLAFGSVYDWGAGTAPTMTATNGAVDVYTFISDGTNMRGSFVQDYS